jgi:hypothetical protein
MRPALGAMRNFIAYFVKLTGRGLANASPPPRPHVMESSDSGSALTNVNNGVETGPPR